MLPLWLRNAPPAMEMEIRGKVVLVTGASSGIGLATADAFTACGATVIRVSRHTEPGNGIACDLTDSEARRRMMTDAGPIDILVNNAGAGLYSPSFQAPMDQVRAMFELNFFALLELTQLAVPSMRSRGGGCIVNVASVASKVTLPWFTLYSASKAAVESFTRGLRMELKGSGVHAMLVCPGYVKTGFQQNVLVGKPPMKLASGRRFGVTAQTVAEAIVDGVVRGRNTVMTPRSGWALVAASRLAPNLVDAQLSALQTKTEREGR